MKIYTVSDIHIDYSENKNWLFNISESDYKEDILILAGDITDILVSITQAFELLRSRFRDVFYVPGNHDLWVHRNKIKDSLESFGIIKAIADDYGVKTGPVHYEEFSIIPLYGWFDFSFGFPTQELYQGWYDFTACKWPEGYSEGDVTNYFISLNEDFIENMGRYVISFSHFLPRIDLMPRYIPASFRWIYPVLGTSLLEQQIRRLGSHIHVYGHSHLNRRVMKDNILYINNAYGYPSETRITAKQLLCIHEV